jgi:hypothetical protein
VNYGPKIVTNGLVFALDAADRNSYAGSGTTWNDMSGNNNTGTLTNGPAFSNTNGGSIIFDGVDDFVNCGNADTINFGTGDFTIEMWALRSTNATTNLRLLSKGGDSNLANTAGFAFFGYNGGASFAVNPSGTRTIISAATYSVGEWFNVVGVVQRSSTIRTYKNAILVESAAAPIGSVSNASLNLNIARNTADLNLNWSGQISIVRMYNKALTAREVLQNYNATKLRFGL